MSRDVVLEMLRHLPELWPPWLFTTFLLAFGLILGSFLNVVIHRVPIGQSVVTPRSRCPSCNRLIRAWENVPVLSWLGLGGRCAGCGQVISFRYAAVELLTAGLVLLAHAHFGWTPAFPIAVAFGSMVLALVFTDLEHMLLPDAITLPGTFVGLCLSWISPLVEPGDALLGVLFGLFVMEAMNLAYKLLRGRDGFGAGDTKMMMLVGAFLGWELAILCLILACFIGSVSALPWVLVRRRASRSEPPEAEPSPADDGPTEADEEAAPEGGPHPSVLESLVPATPEEAVGPLTFIALVASFTVPWTTPRIALAGLLVGLILMRVQDAIVDRLRPAAVTPLTRRSELWALAGSVAGLPVDGFRAALAAGVVIVWFVLAILVRPVLRGREPEPEAEPSRASSPAAPLMQAELPFGVFLGIGALLSLFAGVELITWYFDRVGGLFS